MKIRFLRTIAGARVTFYAGQVIEVGDNIPPDLAVFLRPGRDGLQRAEILEDAVDVAVDEAPERAVAVRVRRRRPS